MQNYFSPPFVRSNNQEEYGKPRKQAYGKPKIFVPAHRVACVMVDGCAPCGVRMDPAERPAHDRRLRGAGPGPPIDRKHGEHG
jgi:hypothetical protein